MSECLINRIISTEIKINDWSKTINGLNFYSYDLSSSILLTSDFSNWKNIIMKISVPSSTYSSTHDNIIVLPKNSELITHVMFNKYSNDAYINGWIKFLRDTNGNIYIQTFAGTSNHSNVSVTFEILGVYND